MPQKQRNRPPTRNRETVGGVTLRLLRHPIRDVLLHWNWKAALGSAIFRGALFLGVNLPAGRDAAVSAFITEFWFRLVASGVYGAVMQEYRHARPRRTALLTMVVVIPATVHVMEFLVHWWRGTALLGWSMLASVGFTVIMTAFMMFAMQRGVLIVGDEKQSVADDARAIPWVVWDFARTIGRAVQHRLGR